MDFAALYQRYSQEKVDKALEILNYKKPIGPLPKDEDDNLPTVYIFRHGQSEDNLEMIFSGWRDPGLTENGRKGAAELAELLKDKKFGMLISSTQKRAIETMQVAISKNEHAKKLEIIKDDRLRERNYGVLNGYSKLELFLWNEKLLEAFRRGFDVIPPEGESLKMVCERVANFCDEVIPLIKSGGFDVAISCHGNSIRGFRKYFEKLSDEEVTEFETPLAKDYLAYSLR